MNLSHLALELLVIFLVIGVILVIRYLLRRARDAEARVERANNCLSAWAHVLTENLRSGVRSHELAEQMVSLCSAEFDTTGVLLLGPLPKESLDVPVLAMDGACREWVRPAPDREDTPRQEPEQPFHNPPRYTKGQRAFDPTRTAGLTLRRDDSLVLNLGHDLPHHFFWSQEPMIYRDDNVREWMPTGMESRMASLMVSPVSLPGKRLGLFLLFRDSSQAPFYRSDQSFLSAIVKLTEARFQRLSLERQLTDLADQLEHAHEEGMLQVSTGVVHNIGNAVAVIQLAMERVRCGPVAATSEFCAFLVDELLPAMHEAVKSGSEAQTRTILESIDTLAKKLQSQNAELAEQSRKLAHKFESVTEVIALQQRFMGELGTENVTSIASVFGEVERMGREAMEQREVTLSISHEATAKVLLDPAMLQHVLLLMLKYALDSVLAAKREEKAIDLVCFDEHSSGKDWVVIELHDTGIGAPLDLDASDVRHMKAGAEQKLRDFTFCRQRIEKYGGSLGVSGTMARGSTIRILLPAFLGEKRVQAILREKQP